MSHLCLLDLETDAARTKLFEAAHLTSKGRTCFVINPFRQEVW